MKLKRLEEAADAAHKAGKKVAARLAQAEKDQPSLLIVRTHIGYGSPKQDSFEAHGEPIGPEATRKTKKKLGWPTEPTYLVPDDALAHLGAAAERGAQLKSR